MVSQLRNLHLDKDKGITPGKSQQVVDELEYLVTFKRSITQAMACTMQDLSEGIFMNNLTLARRDSYLEYLRAVVKQDTHCLAYCTTAVAVPVPGPFVSQSRRGREAFFWQLTQEAR